MAIDNVLAELSLKYDTVLPASIATQDEIDHNDLPFFDNVRHDGVAV